VPKKAPARLSAVGSVANLLAGKTQRIVTPGGYLLQMIQLWAAQEMGRDGCSERPERRLRARLTVDSSHAK